MIIGGQMPIASPGSARRIRPCARHLATTCALALSGRVELLLGGLVAHQLDAAEQADPARLADQRMLAQALQAAQEVRRRPRAHGR